LNVGDIYAFFNERLGCYNACQITGFKNESNQLIPSILLLDWTEERLPIPADLPSLKPFIRNHYNWDNVSVHDYNYGFDIEAYTYCGNYQPFLASDDLRNPNILPYEDELLIQSIWDNIPLTLREVYKNSEEKKWRLFENEMSCLFPDFVSYTDFNKYPRLTTLSLSVFTDALRDYIKNNPIINELNLNGQQLPSLDFRGTGLQQISIDVSGVKEIYLNDITRALVLNGSPEPDLLIYDLHQGRFLNLTINGNGYIPRGIEQLRNLRIANIVNIDLLKAIGANRAVEELHLHGKLGVISNLSALSTLKRLKRLQTYDVFGFVGADFPSPEELPSLNSIDMESLPDEAAQAIKEMYKPLKEKGLNLYISKTRKPEWLAENLDNPFRDWDGDELIPNSCAKKAFDTYKKTRAGLTKICQSQSKDVQAESLTLCKAYIDVFNKIESKHGFIDTIFCEQIIEALNNLVSEVNSATGSRLDTTALMNDCDAAREF